MSATKAPGRSNGTRWVIALLAGIFAFAFIAQTQQAETDSLASLRQADLVRILDELTTREQLLTAERDALRTELADLDSGATDQAAAQKAAEERARSLSIQAGVIPVEGPGIWVRVQDPSKVLTAQSFVSLVEELRNSGAEAIEINRVRLGINSWFKDDGGVIVDGTKIGAPYVVVAIGNTNTMAVALEMPGGVLAAFRNAGASPEITELENVQIESVRDIPTLSYATVVE